MAPSLTVLTSKLLCSYSYHIGLGVAASTRVGNAIGRRDAAGAKFTGHLSALLSVITGTIVMISLLLAKDVRPSQPLLTQLILKKQTGIRVSLQQRGTGRTPRQSSDAPRRLFPSRGRLGRFLRRRVERTGKTASRRGVQPRSLLRTRITSRHRTCLPLGVWSPRSLDRYVHPSFSFFSSPLPSMRDHLYVNAPLTTITYRPGGGAFYSGYVRVCGRVAWHGLGSRSRDGDLA